MHLHRSALNKKTKKTKTSLRRHKNRRLRRKLPGNLLTKNPHSLQCRPEHVELRPRLDDHVEYHEASQRVQQESLGNYDQYEKK